MPSPSQRPSCHSLGGVASRAGKATPRGTTFPLRVTGLDTGAQIAWAARCGRGGIKARRGCSSGSRAVPGGRLSSGSTGGDVVGAGTGVNHWSSGRAAGNGVLGDQAVAARTRVTMQACRHIPFSSRSAGMRQASPARQMPASAGISFFSLLSRSLANRLCGGANIVLPLRRGQPGHRRAAQRIAGTHIGRAQ